MGKKRLLVIPLILAFALLLFTPRAYAEGSEETQTATEVVEFEKKNYTITEDNVTSIVTLVDETNAEIYTASTDETVQATYTVSDNVLCLKVGETYKNYTINSDNSLTLIPTKVSITDRANDFLEKWLNVVLASVSGLSGTLLAVALCKAVIKRLIKKLEDGTKQTEEERKKNLEDLANTKELLKEQQAQLQVKIEEAKNLLPSLIADFEALKEQFFSENQEIISLVKGQSLTIDQLKNLVCLLVSSTPELASNGYASQILTLLNVRVGGNDETNEHQED